MREKERQCVFVLESERECVCEEKRLRVLEGKSVCVCVRERERVCAGLLLRYI